MWSFNECMEWVAKIVDAAGVMVIFLGLALATAHFLRGGRHAPDAYRRYRHGLGRGILLGLEFLVAADIIRTVAVKPTLSGVLVLAIVVLIRTFLSIALEVELEGRWPRQRGQDARQAPETSAETPE